MCVCVQVSRWPSSPETTTDLRSSKASSRPPQRTISPPLWGMLVRRLDLSVALSLCASCVFWETTKSMRVPFRFRGRGRGGEEGLVEVCGEGDGHRLLSGVQLVAGRAAAHPVSERAPLGESGLPSHDLTCSFRPIEVTSLCPLQLSLVSFVFAPSSFSVSSTQRCYRFYFSSPDYALLRRSNGMSLSLCHCIPLKWCVSALGHVCVCDVENGPLIRFISLLLFTSSHSHSVFLISLSLSDRPGDGNLAVQHLCVMESLLPPSKG